jgi:hypothetical protein
MNADNQHVPPPRKVTVESLTSGADRELSRVSYRGRVMLFVLLEEGSLGLVQALLDREDRLFKVLGCFRLPSGRADELAGAVGVACEKLEESE